MSKVESDALRSIRGSAGELEQAVRARDAARAVEQACAEDGVLLPPDQPMVRGKAQIAELLQGMFRIGLRDLTLEAVSAEASGELAYEVGRYRMMLDLEGTGRVEEEGKYLTVLRRQPNGAWKAVASVYNVDAPRG
jgi:ketosteroid isomerase-like protein